MQKTRFAMLQAARRDRDRQMDYPGQLPISSSPAANGLSVAVITDPGRRDGFQAEWSHLLAESGQKCLFLTGEWLLTWWRHFARDRWKLGLLTVRRRKRLLGIAPLFSRPEEWGRLPSWWRTTHFLGSGIIGSDYLDVIVRGGEDESVAAALAEHLERGRPTLTLTHMPAWGAQAEGLIRELEQSGWVVERSVVERCPYIPLRKHTWDSYAGTLGAEHRYNFQRRLKNLHKQGVVTFEAVEKEELRREALATLRSLHDRCWEERGGSQAMQSERESAFHEDFSRLALERGWLRLFLLKLNGRPLAALYGFRYGTRFYFYQSGFDPSWRKHSVGLVTMGLAIQQALREGVEEFDLLHGTESYKFLWTKETRDLVRVRLFPPSWAGLIRQQAAALETRAKELARLLLPPDLLERLAAKRRRAA
ncbi:MAG TPA: GNAT family N-acetyltransferase [Nitrospira sp.]|nr:GNAT family N-acetyltransferase [Nitrospira sp.]